MNFVSLFVFILAVHQGFALYCYRCVSTHPGCGTPFDWRWYWGWTCPDYNDKCVKIIERKGTDVVITRDCLSALRDFRTDIPADHYEGCRPAAKDARLAHYVNNTIKELDIKRNYYDETTWCFCFFDDRCNGSPKFIISLGFLIGCVLSALLLK